MIDSGTPRSSTRSIRLLPFFSPIRRVGSDRFLSKRCLDHGPIDTLPSPSDALHLVILGQSRLPQRLEHPRLRPLQETFVDRTGAAEAFSGQRPPLTAPAPHVHHRPQPHPP